MCGIVGYIGQQMAVPVILDGLKRLEYRGYDSAGIAVCDGDHQLLVRRAKGKLANLEAMIEDSPIHGHYGVGHTRWATHGRPSEDNAHPHRDCGGNFVVVHNGIVENYLPLKNQLEAEGHKFKTETDTEVVAHLLEKHFQGDLVAAVRAAIRDITGVYALAVVSRLDPGKIIAARSGPPVVIGLGINEFFVASDVPAILNHTRDMLFLADGEVAVLTADGVRLTDANGLEVNRASTRIGWDPIMAEKNGYKHFMLKEIHEQPRAVRDTTIGRLRPGTGEVVLDWMDISAEEFASVRNVRIIACGTSWHAGLTGKFMIEKLARIPVEVDYGSEFRYRDPIVTPDTLTVVISQSGETADTLAAQREAKKKGSKTLAICNVVGSMITREAAGSIITHAGPEIGVASTKAFTSQLTALFLLAMRLGQANGQLDRETSRQLGTELLHIPAKLETLLSQRFHLSRPHPCAASFQGFPVPGTGRAFPDGPGRRAQAEGNLLHSRRRLSRRRNEARSQRADRRRTTGGGAGDARRRQPGEPTALREDTVQYPGSEGARRYRGSGGDGRRQSDPEGGRRSRD